VIIWCFGATKRSAYVNVVLSAKSVGMKCKKISTLFTTTTTTISV